jgi:hypothetical protein
MSRLSVMTRPRLDPPDLATGDRPRRLHPATGPALLAVTSFIVLWPFARLDFDRHHDGYMLAQALAVHQGGAIHGDAFAQYGPVTPWLQSAALFLPMGPALALRTLNVALIAVTVFLLADMGRNSPKSWPVSRAVGCWAAVAWILLADVWIAFSMLPWSSTLTALLSVATLYLLTRSLRFAEDGRTRAASVSGLAGGALLGLMPFTRINVGLSAVAVCLVVAALTFAVERGSKRTLVKFFVLGTFLSSLTVVLVLFSTHSLDDFYYQAFEWPLTWGPEASGRLNTATVIMKAFAFQAMPVGLVCGVLFLQLRVRGVQHRLVVSKPGVKVFTVLIGLITLVWENSQLFLLFQASSRRVGFLKYLRLSNVDFIDFFAVLAIALTVIVCLTQLSKAVHGQTPTQKLIPWLLLGGLAISGLTQVIPTWDARHVWWAAPVGLLLVFSVLQKITKLNTLTDNPLILPLVGVVAVAVVSGAADLTAERVSGPQGTIIEGMRVSRTNLNQIGQDSQFLTQELPPNQPAVYLVNDGDLSILDGKYRSADSYFVAWGGSPKVQSRTVGGAPVVVQRSFYTERKISDLARSIRYEVVARNPRLVVLLPAGRTAD